ncbi:hypothetical protein I4U23_030471 [Adineta vaga]|nr:hypothetical protein I4U23_030471 [Adineta vaga]
MNSDQQAYYLNTNELHPPPSGHFNPNGLDYATISNSYSTNYIPHPQYNHQMPNIYQQQQIYMPPYSTPPFNHPNGFSNAGLPIVRPPNEQQNAVPNGAMNVARTPLFVPPQPTQPSQPYRHTSFPAQGNVPQYAQFSQMNSGLYTPVHNQQVQPPLGVSQSIMSSQNGYSSLNTQATEKRKKNPLVIVDPTSNQPVKVEKTAAVIHTPLTVTSNESKKIPTDKKVSVSINDGVIDTHNEATSNKTSERTQSSQPASVTRSNNNEKLTIEPNQNDIEEDEQDHSEASEPLDINSMHSETASDNEIPSAEERLSSNSSEQLQETSPRETSENIPPTSTEEGSPKSNRYRYSIKELLSKRAVPLAQQRPANLRFVREIEVEKQKLIDANNKFLREVRLILNKLTPQTRTKLVEQLEKLELDRYERLEGMIDIIFSKAVEEPKYCFMYAELCDSFKKKQVTVPNENGETTTFSFRQILISRCQKGFENDYRQDINYDQRKIAVDAITDEKLQKEEAENLEEALNKAKRRNFGNILFIGELFKLNMLTENIMYSCMEYLLEDKTDEENLECLCRLLRTIGKTFDDKKSANVKKLEKTYTELNEIVEQRQTSARIRFMIQDLLELREAEWIPRIAEAKPVSIDQIREQDRIKREKEESDRQQRTDQYRNGASGNNNYGQNHPPLYTGSRGSRGSGSKQQSNRPGTDRMDKGFNVSSIRQYQANDKKTTGPFPLNLKPQAAWSKASTTEKKNEDDQTNANRTTKTSVNSVPSFRPQTATYAKISANNSTQRPSAQGLAQNNEEVNSNNTSMANSREGSRVVSREQSRNASPDSNSTKISVPSSTAVNQTFDEVKIHSRVQALSEEYTENYSESTDRPVTDAIEDLSDFCTSKTNEQAIIIRELLTNVLEAKPRARKAIGHLLAVTLQRKVISNEGFLAGLQMVIDTVPDYIVDIPRIWQYIGEILGAFMGVTESNILLLKSIVQSISDEKSKQLFEYIIRYAVEFSSKDYVQKCWQSAGYTLNDLLKSNVLDSSFVNEYSWLSGQQQSTASTNDNSIPCADPELIQLFKSMGVQNTSVTDSDIHAYIHKHMNSDSKFYIRNIVLSYLEAHLKDFDENETMQDFIENQRLNILHEIIQDKPEAELEAIYAIQNFVTKLEHPQKMAQLLFDKFYDEDCVSEEIFNQWLTKPNQSEIDGHKEIVKSTEAFFHWLQHADVDEEKARE